MQTILVVEDSPTDRGVMIRYLQDAGLTVVAVGSG
jgi:CheY-like chemotaxis protein